MVIEAYVFDKIKVSEKVTQIVIRKKHNERYNYICFVAFGFIKDSIDELDIDQKDKVRIEYYIKSKKWNERYSTDAIIEKIELPTNLAKSPFLSAHSSQILTPLFFKYDIFVSPDRNHISSWTMDLMCNFFVVINGKLSCKSKRN